MSTISDVIADVRVLVNDSDSTRWADDTSEILPMVKRAIRRVNHLLARNDINFARSKQAVTIKTDGTIEGYPTDVLKPYNLYRPDLKLPVTFCSPEEWEQIPADVTNATFWTIIGGTPYVNGEPEEDIPANLYYYPLIDTSSYSTSTTIPWNGKLDDIIADYAALLLMNIDEMDIFCAVTNDEQINILSAMLAKRMGARKVMALINRPAYVDLVQSSNIDIAISPEQATIGTLLARVRRGDVVVVHSLRRGAAEAIEAIAHGDENSSKVVGRRVDQIKLPPGTTIDAIVRGEEVIIAHHYTVIKPEDHVILFLTDKKRIAAVERLFQVGVMFL